MKKTVFKASLAAILFLTFIISLSISVFAQDCPHTDTVVLPSSNDTHDVICINCHYHVKNEECFSDNTVCGIRPVCEVCGEEFGPPPLPHIPSDTLAANDEYHYTECINCSEPYPDTEEAHEYGEWFTTLSATEETEGEEARECSLCEYRQTRTTPLLEPKETSGALIALIAVALFSVAFAVGIVLFKKETLKELLSGLKK